MQKPDPQTTVLYAVCWAKAGEMWTCSPALSWEEAVRDFHTLPHDGDNLAVLFNGTSADDVHAKAMRRMQEIAA